MEAAREAREKGDTATFRSDMQQARALSQPIQTQENNEIRNILTPEQQTKFDARQKEMANRRAMGGKGWKKGERLEKGEKKGA
jgi:Spy/CpxP family protein refolding chaperone